MSRVVLLSAGQSSGAAIIVSSPDDQEVRVVGLTGRGQRLNAVGDVCVVDGAMEPRDVRGPVDGFDFSVTCHTCPGADVPWYRAQG